jgi:hypothetical protein
VSHFIYVVIGTILAYRKWENILNTFRYFMFWFLLDTLPTNLCHLFSNLCAYVIIFLNCVCYFICLWSNWGFLLWYNYLRLLYPYVLHPSCVLYSSFLVIIAILGFVATKYYLEACMAPWRSYSPFQFLQFSSKLAWQSDT